MAMDVPQAGHEIVCPETGREFDSPDRTAFVHREDELLRPHEVRSEPPQPLALATGLEDQADIALLEVTEPSVDQLRGSARGAGGEVCVLDERRPEAAHRAVARDTRPVDAGGDDAGV